MKKGDIILILLLVIPAAVFLIFMNRNSYGGHLTVYVDGDVYGTYDLNEDGLINIKGCNGIEDTICISNNSVYMYDANCSDKLCMQMGTISKDKESVCCAPGGILAVIESDKKTEYDAITR